MPPVISSVARCCSRAPEEEDGIDRVRVVDVIGGDARGVGRAGRLRGELLIKEAALLHVTGEYFAFADVLVADGGSEVFPARIFGIGRRVGGIWRNVAGATSDADTIGPNEMVVVVITRIVHEPRAIPFPARFVIKLRIGKESEAENAGWFAVDFLIDPGRLGRDLFVEPEAVVIGFGGGAETGLVAQAERLEAFAARVPAIVEHLQRSIKP